MIKKIAKIIMVILLVILFDFVVSLLIDYLFERNVYLNKSLINYARDEWFTKGFISLLFVGGTALLYLFFYPSLLKYQLGNKVSEYIDNHSIDKKKFYSYQITDSRSLDFYNNYNYKKLDDLNASKTGEYVLVETTNIPDSVLLKFNKIDIISSFHVSTLNGEFLNPKTRDSALNYFYILQKK